MNRTYRSLFAGMLAMMLLFLGLRVFLSPPWSRTVEGDGWRAQMPMPSLGPEKVVEGPWTLVEAVGSARFRVGTMPLSLPAGRALDLAADDLHCSPVERVPLPSMPGWFLLSGAGKSWRATLIFPSGDRLFRVEAWENRGNAAEPLRQVARMAASLEMGEEGVPAMPVDPDALEAIVGTAVGRHLIGMDAILPWMVPLVGLIFGVVFVVVRIAGRIPPRAPGAPPARLAEAGVSLEIRKGRLVRRQTVGALVLDSEGLHVFTMGREIVKVPAAQLTSVRRAPGTRSGRPFDLRQDNLRILFYPRDPEAWERALSQG